MLGEHSWENGAVLVDSSSAWGRKVSSVSGLHCYQANAVLRLQVEVGAK